MYCQVDYDLRRYLANEEAVEDAQAAKEAEEIKSKHTEISAALATCNPLEQVRFFGDVEYLLNDAASQNDYVSNAMCKALLEAAKRGEGYAIVALKQVINHFLEVV